jgi:hypothetical protein
MSELQDEPGGGRVDKGDASDVDNPMGLDEDDKEWDLDDRDDREDGLDKNDDEKADKDDDNRSVDGVSADFELFPDCLKARSFKSRLLSRLCNIPPPHPQTRKSDRTSDVSDEEDKAWDFEEVFSDDDNDETDMPTSPTRKNVC